MAKLASIEFGLTPDNRYFTKRRIVFRDVKVPRGFVFDGVSVKAPWTGFFGNKTLREGIKASCVHDYMCDHKDQYDRKTATKYLIEVWRENGLSGWRAWLVKRAVNRYQKAQGWC